MKQTKFRYLSILLVLAMMISAIPAQLFEAFETAVYADATVAKVESWNGWNSTPTDYTDINEALNDFTGLWYNEKMTIYSDVSANNFDGSIDTGKHIILNNYALTIDSFICRNTDNSSMPEMHIENSSEPEERKIKLTEVGKYVASGDITVKGGIFFGNITLNDISPLCISKCNIIGDINAINVNLYNGATVIGDVTVSDKCYFYDGSTLIGSISEDKIEKYSCETIKYYANSSLYAVQGISSGSKATPPVIKSNLVFDGWYKDNTLTQKFDFDTTTITGETKLYAKFKKRSYASPMPQLASGLTYNASPQSLIASGGTVNGGTIKYSTDNSTYSESFPTGENAGDYEVWYKVDGNEEWTGIEPTSLGTVTIAKANVVEITPNPASARVITGKTLNDATDIVYPKYYALDGTTELSGTYTWSDASTVVNASGDFPMTFTPDNQNYEPVTFNVTVTAYTPSSGGSGATLYMIKFVSNGGSEVVGKTAAAGRTVSAPNAPKREGYTFDGWYADKELTEKYDFSSKITGNLTLYAGWTKKGETSDDDTDKNEDNNNTDDNNNDDNADNPNGGTVTPPQGAENPFSDVDENSWYFNYVINAYEKGLMSGKSSSQFAPSENLTRAMAVTVLYRTAGSPAVNTANKFADVSPYAYYADAVNWAAENGIVFGTDGNKFAPDAPVTREQMAAILLRYADYIGIDTSVAADTNILSYTDFSEISKYAVEAFQFTVGSGIMVGVSASELSPQTYVTRAEMAVIVSVLAELSE